MAIRKRQQDVRLFRLQAQTKVIRSMNKLLLAVAGLVLGCAALATWLPQKRELARLEAKLEETERLEREVLAEKSHRDAELQAMREDREFLELKAMDRLNLHRPGDKVYRVRSRGEGHGIAP